MFIFYHSKEYGLFQLKHVSPLPWFRHDRRFCRLHFNITIFSSIAMLACTFPAHVITLATMATLAQVFTIMTESSLAAWGFTPRSDISIYACAHSIDRTATLSMRTVTKT